MNNNNNNNEGKNVRALGVFFMFIVLLVIGFCYYGCHLQGGI